MKFLCGSLENTQTTGRLRCTCAVVGNIGIECDAPVLFDDGFNLNKHVSAQHLALDVTNLNSILLLVYN